jgi:23S rRNA pseudouridine2605 synthase
VLVDGVPAAVGDRIDPATSAVTVDGVRLTLDPDLVTWLLYKPVGVISTMDDPQGRPTVRSLVPDDPVTNPVGRLDVHSEGLMLMTNDGDLALVVTHPRYEVPKTYHVLVPGRVSRTSITSLTDGVILDDGPAKAASARIVSAEGQRTIVELILTEGRKREIRRMFTTVDLEIDRLVRVGIGPIADRSLKPGTHRALTLDEIRSLFRYARHEDIHD